MKKILLLILMVCLIVPASFAKVDDGYVQTKETIVFKGQFLAWAPLYNLDHFSVTIFVEGESYEALILLIGADSEVVRYEDQRFSLHLENDETLEKILKSLATNHRMLKEGIGFYGSVAEEILSIEEFHFEAVKKAKSMKIFSFEGKEWYLGIERIYIFYDENGDMITSWAYCRFTQIYNFCIPE